MRESKNRDAYESGCNGLKEGWAYIKATGQRIHASAARKKDGPFICKACLSDAVHHYCSEKIDHFAHHARLTPIIDSHESEIHKLCKESIYKELKNKFSEHKWVCDDVRIPERKEECIPALQPDIGGQINGQRVAIEIQTSAMTISKILKRCLGYSKRGISILWVIPLIEPIGDEIFRPRLFERYLHSIYYGRVYYWLPEYGCKVLPVHFSTAVREIPYREWFEDGEEREGGGYDKPYKHIRKPAPLRPISIAENFYHMARQEHRPWNERKTVPAMRILMDKEPIWWNKKEQSLLDRYYKEEIFENNV
jgi:competence protein CoiA